MSLQGDLTVLDTENPRHLSGKSVLTSPEWKEYFRMQSLTSGGLSIALNLFERIQSES